jgi:toxin YoeB
VKVQFSTRAWQDYLYWQTEDRNVLERVSRLIDECRRMPFRGTGKPEPLRGELSGWWSRRVTLEDRLVYRSAGKGDAQKIEILQCRYHY